MNRRGKSLQGKATANFLVRKRVTKQSFVTRDMGWSVKLIGRKKATRQ